MATKTKTKAKKDEGPKRKVGRPRVHPEKPKHDRPGAPSKFKPEYSAQVVEHMGKGFSFDSFAGTISVSVATVYNWCNEFPEFLEARKIGEAKRLLRLEMQGQDLIAKGGGNGSASTWIFHMKAVAKWEDQAPIEVPFAFATLDPKAKAMVVATARKKEE